MIRDGELGGPEWSATGQFFNFLFSTGCRQPYGCLARLKKVVGKGGLLRYNTPAIGCYIRYISTLRFCRYQSSCCLKGQKQ
jgi:hypothetical protein